MTLLWVMVWALSLLSFFLSFNILQHGTKSYKIIQQRTTKDNRRQQNTIIYHKYKKIQEKTEKCNKQQRNTTQYNRRKQMTTKYNKIQQITTKGNTIQQMVPS